MRIENSHEIQNNNELQKNQDAQIDNELQTVTKNENDEEALLIQKKNKLEWSNLTYEITTKKKKKLKILKNLTGSTQSGEILAIIGPSGSGKSTFLDVISGRRKSENIEGKVLLNSRPEKKIKYLSTYIMQSEVMYGNLTVRENIKFSSQLNIKKGEKENSKDYNDKLEKRIDQIIKEFGLTKVEKAKIGTAILRGVSGGEKRRAYIASQIVSYDRIVFLDEPTSGLDSASSFYVIESIKNIAKHNNIIVIMTIHQPSPPVFKLLDNLLVLANGECLYMGKADKVVDYYDSIGHTVPIHVNPPDHILDLVNLDFLGDKKKADDTIRLFADKWADSKKHDEEDLEYSREVENQFQSPDPIILEKTAGSSPRGFFAQTGVLTHRAFLNAIRNPILYWVRLAMFIALAILMATTWINTGTHQDEIQDRLSLLFFAVAFPCFMQVAGIPAFLEDRLMFIREYNNGSIGVLPYIISNTLISIPFIALITFCFTVILYPSVGLNEDAFKAFIFALCLFLLLMTSEAMTIFISSIIPIFVAALAIVSFLNGFFMIVTGYFIRVENLPKFWLWGHYIAYHKYGFEAMVHNDIDDLNFDCNETKGCMCYFERANESICKMTGDDVLTEFGYEDVNLWLWIGIIAIMFVIYKIGFFIMLKRSYKQN